MKTEQFRKLITLCEARQPDLEYVDTPKSNSVVVKITGNLSGEYTKLAQKIQKLDALEAEIKTLKAEIKDESKQRVADLFDAEDAAKIRVVQTIQFVYRLSANPAEQSNPKYKEILEELTNSLTPELILVLEELKKKFVTKVQKSPIMKLSKIGESSDDDMLSKLKHIIFNWAKSYDARLEHLEQEARM